VLLTRKTQKILSLERRDIITDTKSVVILSLRKYFLRSDYDATVACAAICRVARHINKVA